MIGPSGPGSVLGHATRFSGGPPLVTAISVEPSMLLEVLRYMTTHTGPLAGFSTDVMAYLRSGAPGHDELAVVFTPDGVFEITKSGDQPTRLVTGTKELAGFCAEVSEYYQGLHFNTPPRLRIDGDVAWGQVHFQWIGIFRPGATHSGQRHAAGYYQVNYRRLEIGWRIERRVETQISGNIVESFDPVIAAMSRDVFRKP